MTDKVREFQYDRAIYIQLNDAVIDWGIAWFNSLAATGCKLPVIILPWDKNIDQVKRYFVDSGKAVLFDRSIAPDLYEFAENVGRTLHPSQPKKWPLFHRLIPFLGPIERYIFSDADIVLLKNPNPFLDCLDGTVEEFLFASVSRGFVYNPKEVGRMVQEYGTAEFNAGFFASRNDVLGVGEILDALNSLQEQPDLLIAFERPPFRRSSDVWPRRYGLIRRGRESWSLANPVRSGT